MLVYLRDKLRLNGKTTFSRAELNQILTLYGSRVQTGAWRDYAIDNLPNTAIFSIYKSSKELPLYTISKEVGRSAAKPARYSVAGAQGVLKESTSLLEIIDYLGNL